MKRADIAQSVECILGKDEVTGSNPVISSMNKGHPIGVSFFLLVVEPDLMIFGVPEKPLLSNNK